MKLQEVKDYYKNLSDEALLEHVEQNNDTGFSNEDVAKIIRMGNDPAAWSAPMTGEQLLQEIMESIKNAPGGEKILAEVQAYTADHGYDIC